MKTIKTLLLMLNLLLVGPAFAAGVSSGELLDSDMFVVVKNGKASVHRAPDASSDALIEDEGSNVWIEMSYVDERDCQVGKGIVFRKLGQRNGWTEVQVENVIDSEPDDPEFVSAWVETKYVAAIEPIAPDLRYTRNNEEPCKNAECTFGGNKYVISAFAGEGNLDYITCYTIENGTLYKSDTVSADFNYEAEDVDFDISVSDDSSLVKYGKRLMTSDNMINLAKFSASQLQAIVGVAVADGKIAGYMFKVETDEGVECIPWFDE